MKRACACALGPLAVMAFTQVAVAQVAPRSQATTPPASVTPVPGAPPATGVPTAVEDASPKAANKPSHGLIALPILFTAPESGVGFGAFGLYYWHLGAVDTTRPSQIRSAVAFTTKEQFQFDVGPSLWLSDNKFYIEPSVLFQNFPQPFFGIGNGEKSGDSETFTARRYSARASVGARVLAHTYLGLQYVFDHTDIVNPKPGGLIATHAVLGSEGGVSSGVGPSVTFDSRDNVYAASHGSYAALNYIQRTSLLGSDFDWGAASLDLRHYIALGDQVLAFQVAMSVMDGAIPFYSLAALGGPTLRGVYRGMFIDNNSFEAQVELRVPIFGPLLGSAFLGTGEVMRRLDTFSPSGFHTAGGAGLRYLLIPEEKIGVRLDIAYSEQGPAYYLDVGEAF